ncbi:MAG: hypothetical protein RI907_3181 [Pseudomonadota bacterium]|jgi:MSHA pilin protein MshD
MSNDRQRGFTLVEVIVAIVVIGVGMAGVMMAFSQSVRSSADPVVSKQMLILAEEFMEEVSLKAYSTPSATAPTDCARLALTTVGAYNGYSQSKICDIDGVTQLTGYGVAIAVVSTTLGAVTDAVRITVTITHGTETLVLNGWRTFYAQEPPP